MWFVISPASDSISKDPIAQYMQKISGREYNLFMCVVSAQYMGRKDLTDHIKAHLCSYPPAYTARTSPWILGETDCGGIPMQLDYYIKSCRGVCSMQNDVTKKLAEGVLSKWVEGGSDFQDLWTGKWWNILHTDYVSIRLELFP